MVLLDRCDGLKVSHRTLLYSVVDVVSCEPLYKAVSYVCSIASPSTMELLLHFLL